MHADAARLLPTRLAVRARSETLASRRGDGAAARPPRCAANAWLFERFGVSKQHDWPVAPYACSPTAARPASDCVAARRSGAPARRASDGLVLVDGAHARDRARRGRRARRQPQRPFRRRAARSMPLRRERWYLRLPQPRRRSRPRRSPRRAAGRSTPCLPRGRDAHALARADERGADAAARASGQRGARSARASRRSTACGCGAAARSQPRRRAPFSASWSPTIRSRAGWRWPRASRRVRCRRPPQRWLRALPAKASACRARCAARACAYGDADAGASAAALERDWFAPLLAALRHGRIGMLTPAPARAADTLLEVETARSDLRRFWRRRKPLARAAAHERQHDCASSRGRCPPRTRRTCSCARAASGARARLAARGVRAARARSTTRSPACSRPTELLHADRAAALLADAIAAGKRLLIVADYDCDGATACAVGVRALARLRRRRRLPRAQPLRVRLRPHARRSSRSPRRSRSPTCSSRWTTASPASRAWRARANSASTSWSPITICPATTLPRAAAIVNPNQPGCDFPSKRLAGVGVMFYVMLALRAELRKRGAFAGTGRTESGRPARPGGARHGGRRGAAGPQQPHPGRAGPASASAPARMQAGIARAVRASPGANRARAGSFDLGFLLGPRLNAAGRLADMALGIECLITDDAARALNIARKLDDLNRERRAIEAEMQAQADEILLDASPWATASTHQPVRPVLAPGRDRHPRRPHQGPPSPAGDRVRAAATRARLKGSGRSIPACTCATRSTWSPSARPACCCASAATPPPRASPCATADFARFARTVRSGGARAAAAGAARARRSRPTARSSPPTSTWASRSCSSARSGARDSRSRCSATSSRSRASAWSARST